MEAVTRCLARNGTAACGGTLREALVVDIRGRVITDRLCLRCGARFRTEQPAAEPPGPRCA